MDNTTWIFQSLLFNPDYFLWMIALYDMLPNSLSQAELTAIQALLAMADD